MNEIKYPEVEVQLVNQDGNAFAILGRVQSEMKRMDISKDDIDMFFEEATSGDYNHLLRTCEEWVTCF